MTAIGYHSSGDGALPLTPLGRQGNEGALARLAHKIFGGGGGGFVYYQLSGGETAALDVGAVPGTDVYAPVDGTIVGISDYILDGRPYGSRIDIQPSAAPSLVVSLTHLTPDPALTVGSDELRVVYGDLAVKDEPRGVQLAELLDTDCVSRLLTKWTASQFSGFTRREVP